MVGAIKMNKRSNRLLSWMVTATCFASLMSPLSVSSAEVSDADKTVSSKTVLPEAKETPPPFKVAGKVSRTLQTVTGLNLLGSVVAGQTAKLVLKRKLGGDVKVKVKLYSFTDLLSGKVKGVDCSLKNSSVKGVNIGQVTASTNQPVWIDLHDKRHIQLKTPVLVNVKAALTKEQITDALKSEKVAKSLRGLNLDLPGLGAQQLQVVNPKVDIVEDNVCIEALLKAEGADDSTGVPLKITGKLRLKGDDRVEIADMKVESSDIIEPEKFANFAEELLNPLIDLKRMDRRDHAFRLSSLDINQNGLSSEGRLILAPKNPAGVVPVAPAAPTKASAGASSKATLSSTTQHSETAASTTSATTSSVNTPTNSSGIAGVEQKTR